MQDGCYALPGRAHFFAQRAERRRVAERLWRRARRYAAVLATLPTVRMVSITGSLAVNNTEDDADIDFMLLVEGGTLWRTRAAAMVLQRIERRVTDTLCINYLRSDRSLTLPKRSLYVAHELMQTVPLYGEDAYREFLASNDWASEYLPNAADGRSDGLPVRGSRFLRACAGPLVRSGLARRFESWECRRKLERFNRTERLRGEYTEFGTEATGHRDDVRRRVEELHLARTSTTAPKRLNVLFAQSYHLYFDPKLWREMHPYPPLGSLYGAAVARAAGHAVCFHDSMLATSPNGFAIAVDRHRPDVVVLYEDNFNYLTKMCLGRMREAALDMIAVARRAGATVIVCGSDASDNAAVYLGAGADYVIRGEGEGPLVELLAFLHAGDGDASAIRGISWRRDDGGVIANPPMPSLRRLDTLPTPAWDLVDLADYRRIWRQRHGRFSLNLVTTRGCPYHGNWCSKPIWGQQYSVRSPENVVAELRTLVELAGPEHIWFMDDIFGLKPNWVRRFADALANVDLRIRFKCLTRPDLLKREGEIDALAEAGCETVWIGAESGSQTILDAMEKGTEVGDIEDITQRLKARGIRVGFFLQYGYPGETLADIRSTLGMLRRLLPEELGISVSCPLPGTPFYERVQSELGQKRNRRNSDDLAMLFEGPFDPRFYRHLHRHTHRNLRWHQVRAELRDRSLFRRPPLHITRQLAGFAINSAVLPVSWLYVLLLARVGTNEPMHLPVVLDRRRAARPTDQEAGE
jgi:radical SAM superfamily enzyme YgiQ (UPF0313 family)